MFCQLTCLLSVAWDLENNTKHKQVSSLMQNLNYPDQHKYNIIYSHILSVIWVYHDKYSSMAFHFLYCSVI